MQIESLNLKKDPPPVLLIIYKRQEYVIDILKQLKASGVKKIFIASDGPKVEDIELVNDCRSLIVNSINWPCKVEKMFDQENIGPCQFIPKAITWFFMNVEKGIILEDDCVPLCGFIEFCSENLDRYSNSSNIFQISGFNNISIISSGESRELLKTIYPIGWGWATWSNRWHKYYSQSRFSKMKIFRYLLNNKVGIFKIFYWFRFLTYIEFKRFDYWDIKWIFSMWQAGGYSISPTKNLIDYRGIDDFATHTIGKTAESAIKDEPIFSSNFRSAEIKHKFENKIFRSKFKPKRRVKFLKLHSRI